MPATRGSKRRRASSSDAAAATALPTEVMVDSGHAERLRSGLQETWSNDGFDDLPAKVKIRVCEHAGGESQEAAAAASAATVVVKVAPNVAAALSRPLANMLVGPMASVSADGVLTLGADCGTNAEALRVVVSYMYTGTLELQASTTFDVLSATNFLELDVAKGLCVSFLCDSLRPETASSTMAAGAHYSSAELENGARGFVAEHF